MRSGLPLLLCCTMAASEPDDGGREWRTVALNAAVVGGFLTYGAVFWDYGLHRPRGFDEGWFERGSLHGGVDKLGHAYTNLVTGTLFAEIYRDWGWSRSESAALGAGSSLLTTTMIEIGDSFSPAHGFSYQDMAFNAVGCGLAWWRSAEPAAGTWFDLRLEWLPSRAFRRDAAAGSLSDPTTDYAGMSYLLALKAQGPVTAFAAPTWLSAAELHLVYRAQGFEPGDERARQREIGLGFGIDLGWLLRQAGAGDWARIADYYQVAAIRIEPFALALD